MLPRIVVSLLCIGWACAADEKNPPAPDAKMMEAMQLMGTTGAEHAALAKDVGEWDVQETMWMAPGAPPQVNAGHATITAILDGKWFRQDYSGQFMGKPFTGLGLSGYDTVQKKYLYVWLDSFSTPMSSSTGTSTDGGKTITYTSRMELCPMTGGPLTTRSVLVHESADRIVMTMYNTPEGKTEEKAMELAYTRAKKK
jgi:hypothetical protein